MSRKRILIASDIHLCHIDWYGVKNEERVRKFIRDIRAEYEKDPYEMLLLLGDYSLDFWQWDIQGSYLREGLSNTERFCRDYLSQLGDLGVPVYMMPGNHEQYSDARWREITGGSRQGYVICGSYLLILCDTYGAELDPDFHSDGTYLPADTEYISRLMAQFPEKQVILCAHYFDAVAESDGFKALVKRESRIRCLICGHKHISRITPLGEAFDGKPLIFTGNYSYSLEKNAADSMWGFRDLILTDEGIRTRYITPQSTVVLDGEKVQHSYGYQDEAVILFSSTGSGSTAWLL